MPEIEVEDRLRGYAPIFFEEVEMPRDLHARIMSAPARLKPARRRPLIRELAVAAALLVFVAILTVGVWKLRETQRNSPATHATPQLCVSGATQPSGRFALVHGCITYSDGSEIWAVDPNHPANRISLGPGKDLTPIAWSRDGSRLLLLERRNVQTPQQAQDLYVMNADGSRIRLTKDGRSGWGSFSPDGAQVVFSKTFDGLYVVDAKGGTPRLIAKSHLDWWLDDPAWSPDGSRIAYTVYLEGPPSGPNDYEIWTVNPDGTGARRLVGLGRCGPDCTGGLAWSPDGSMLAFRSSRTARPAVPIFAIYVMHADGSGLHRINDNGVQPSWSPDGSRLAFIWYGELYTSAPDGSDERDLGGLFVGSIDIERGILPVYGQAWNPR